MNDRFDFISAGDKPALIAFSSPELLDTAKAALQELNYKVHTAATHGDFIIRFSQIRYEVVILEELFCANTPEENSTLRSLQNMPMSQRRHATIILVGDTFQTFTPMQAFQNSVHAVVSRTELFLLRQLVEKAVADNRNFLHGYHQAQNRVISGKTRD